MRSAKMLIPLLVLVLYGSLAMAQSSSNYRVDESTFTYGGRAVVSSSTSPSFGITLGAVGAGTPSPSHSSSNYSMSGGFVSQLPPPTEVYGVRWESSAVLAWNPEPSTGSYRVYRGSVAGLPAGGGACLASGIELTGFNDSAVPASGSGFYYLITATNRLSEEGPPGSQSDGSMRAGGSACP